MFQTCFSNRSGYEILAIYNRCGWCFVDNARPPFRLAVAGFPPFFPTPLVLSHVTRAVKLTRVGHFSLNQFKKTCCHATFFSNCQGMRANLLPLPHWTIVASYFATFRDGNIVGLHLRVAFGNDMICKTICFVTPYC